MAEVRIEAARAPTAWTLVWGSIGFFLVYDHRPMPKYGVLPEAVRQQMKAQEVGTSLGSITYYRHPR